MRPVVLVVLLAIGALSARAVDLNPQSQDPRAVRRVADRDERPVVLFPEEEGWTLAERNASERVLSRSFVAARPAGAPGMDFITVTVMRDLWNVDLEKAQHHFGEKLGADCPGVRARLWDADSTAGRRLLVWTCAESGQPYAALQLLLQGKDDLFSIEVFCRDGLPGEGLLVRWAQWLKEIRLCDRRRGEPPCPPGNWDD